MSVSLYKKKDRKGWQIEYRHNGIRYQKSLGDIPKKLALKIKAQIEADTLKGDFVDLPRDNIKLSSLAQLNIGWIKQDTRPGTIERMTDVFKQFISFTGDIRIKDVTPEVIRVYMNERSKVVKPRTVNTDYRYLKACFNRAVFYSYIKDNPFNKVKPLKVDETPERFIPPDHLAMFFDSFTQNEQEYRAFFIILFYTGARLSEVLNLTSADISGDYVTFIRTKGRKARKVYLHPEAMKVINALPDRLNNERLFPDLTKDKVRYIMDKILKRAGLPLKYSPHWLRHTFATLSVNKQNIHDIKNILGHSSVSVTEIYTHYQRQYQAEIINKLPTFTNRKSD